ncbi:G patch domain and KOW motifs-containing protein [Spodoptera litura]|uniref:G patch domain and KOW motifs-containing protein n=1 Tax=Spodoptera litura TaxID=69820 RepID=A0A9J7E5H1_SPOLT|nr:G patch domain and KOW motifs-containing protein [Spodoptera litura]
MEAKKISFGFMKTKKVEKPITPVVNEEKREYIECVEEQSIKVIGGETATEDLPLVIPMKPNTLITAEKLKKIAEEVESAVQEPEIKEEPVIKTENIVENETLEQMAVRELMQEAKKEVKVEVPDNLAIPTPAKPVLDGEKESTLDDYESVPIQQFGMAMLRGMGWTPSKDGSKYKQPELRPKGLGLGADKVVKENQKKQAKDKKEEQLVIVKNSFVKITTGKYSGYYGKVVSLDEDNGRVMVDITVKKETVSLSEFMMQAVSKSEYDRESKVINADSYEEYKKSEKVSQKPSKQEERSSTSQRSNELSMRNDREASNNDYRRNREEKSSNGRSRDKIRERRDSSSSEDRSRRKQKKDRRRYSSNDSLSSSEDERRRSKHKSKSRRQRSSSEDSPKRSSEVKRDIDKKRKGKKKKRDRDRSPNYKKHRK